jgi:hypothetical protein
MTPSDTSSPDQPPSDARRSAIAKIRKAIEAVYDEPEVLQRWRALQIDRAIHDFIRFRYGNAIAEAERSLLPAHEIPASELNDLHGMSLDQLRARIAAARDLFDR